jgi:peptidoglycan/xylan/chitin deacetylase (PgdA/CDA1 family)
VRASGRAQLISRGNPARRAVALTFDAGADRGNAARIIDLLKAEGVAATFGVTGQWAAANPDLIRRMATDGHQIVNHTWDHRSFTGVSTRTGPLPAAQRVQELDRTDALIAQLTGRSTKPWFRPPFGDRDPSVDAEVAADGYADELLWTVDSGGWQGRGTAEITSRCLRGAVSGAIYLLHVGSASHDADALPAVIDGLRRAGFSFMTAEALTA